jgi:hypothetical protein
MTLERNQAVDSIMPTMIDPMEPKTATTQTSTSSGDPMSSIEAEIANLAARASHLQRAVGTWNDWYTAALALTLLAAVAVLITNRGVINRQAKLSAVQDALLQAKDRQLIERGRAVANELKEKDVKIGEAAGIAAKANERTANLELDAATQRERAATAERELLELKERLRPRVVTALQGKRFVAELRKVLEGATISLSATSSGGVEAFRLARQLLPLFKGAGWKVTDESSLHLIGDMQFSGVLIMVRVPEDTDMSMEGIQIPATPALSALRSAFSAIGIDVMFQGVPGGTGYITDVVIGTKPQ